MTKKRATIILSGDVQDVGFRGSVMRMAQKLGLVGYTENLPEGSVRVICEGEEAPINDFAKKLDIHNGDIDVEKMDVNWSEPTGEFEWFTVKIIDRDMELFQGFATAGKKLGNIGKKIDNMHADLNEGFSDLKDETCKTHDKLDSIIEATVTTHEKLDKMNDTLNRVADSSDMVHGKLDNIDGRLGDALNRYDVFGQKMISIETEMKEFTKQITRLVDHLVESKKEGN